MTAYALYTGGGIRADLAAAGVAYLERPTENGGCVIAFLAGSRAAEVVVTRLGHAYLVVGGRSEPCTREALLAVIRSRS